MKKAITEILGLDTRELHAKLNELRKEQFGLRFRSSGGEPVRPTRHREVRRSIARIMMVLGDRAKIVEGSKQ
jgi:ribosomal protein L29